MNKFKILDKNLLLFVSWVSVGLIVAAAGFIAVYFERRQGKKLNRKEAQDAEELKQYRALRKKFEKGVK